MEWDWYNKLFMISFIFVSGFLIVKIIYDNIKSIIDSLFLGNRKVKGK